MTNIAVERLAQKIRRKLSEILSSTKISFEKFCGVLLLTLLKTPMARPNRVHMLKLESVGSQPRVYVTVSKTVVWKPLPHRL